MRPVIARLTRYAWRYLYGLGSTLYLFTLGQATAGGRAFLYSLCDRCGYQPVKTLIPRVPLREVLGRDTVLEVHDPLGAPGSVSLLELGVIGSLIRRGRPMRLVEIGTLDGRTTLNMAANAPSGAHVYTLDLPGLSSGAYFAGAPEAAKISQLRGDSATFDWSPFEGTVDFVFIDADHTYPFVTADSRRAVKLLREGRGTIVWHDYGTWEWPGATRALNDLYAEGGVFHGLRRVEGTTLVYLRRGEAGG